MKGERLYKALGDIDDSVLAEYEDSFRRKKIKRIYKICAIAASLCIVFSGTAMALVNSRYFKAKMPESNDASASQQESNTEIALHSEETNEDIAIIKKWSELTNAEKYSEAKYNNIQYCSYGNQVDNKYIGENLGSVKLSATDYTTDKAYTSTAVIYRIKDIADKCAIALKFDDDDRFYAYTNSEYLPDTLQGLIDDLNLKSTINFGYSYIWYENGNNEYKIDDIDDSKVWDVLLKEASAKCTTFDNEKQDRSVCDSLDITISLPSLGYDNRAFTFFADGYVTTNILDTGKTFFIGKKATNQLFNYIKNNGTEITTAVATTSSGVTSSANSGSSSSYSGSASVKTAPAHLPD